MGSTATNRETLSEAEALYLDRVLEDCADLLGPGVEIDGLEIADEPVVTVRLRYRLGEVDWASEGHGPTMIAAHGALRERLVVDRVRLSLAAMVRAGR